MTTLQNFLYPRSRYRGKIDPASLVFNANLQEFSQRVSYISGLQTAGKLSPDESLQKIQSLWQQLQRSYQ
jgi:hypothetical protein